MIKAADNNKSLAIGILTRSFNDNKSANWVIKSDNKRVVRLSGLMEYAFNLCKLQNGVYLSEDNQGAIIYDFPNRTRYTFKRLLADVDLVVNVIGLRRFSKVLKRENYIKKYHPDNDFIYLWFLGVDPNYQGNGTGGKLLQELTKIADNQSLPIYLETSNPQNLSFYKKFGFDIYHEWNADFIGFTVWFMRKESRQL